MAALQGGPINANEYQRSAPEGTPLPPGLYKGIITKTDQKDTAGEKGPGVMVVVEFDITWPEEHSNRKFWDRFNIINPSLDTVRIAREGLADLAKAAYHPDFILQDDEELQGREVVLELYIEKGKQYKDKHTGMMKDGKDQNKCRKYWHVDTDVESAKKAMKEQKSATKAPGAVPAARPSTAPQGAVSNVAQKWGSQKAAAPVAQAAAPQPVQQTVQAASPQPSAGAPVAPWKRNK